MEPMWLATGFLFGLLIAGFHIEPSVSEATSKITSAVQASVQAQNEVFHDLALMRRYNVPAQYFYYVKTECREYDVDLEFALQMILIESGYDETAKSTANAHGLMQLRYPTAREVDPTLQSYWQLYDPRTNIRIGIAYFRALLDRYGGDYRSAAIAYNRGPTRYDLEGDNAPSWYYDRVVGQGQGY